MGSLEKCVPHVGHSQWSAKALGQTGACRRTRTVWQGDAGWVAEDDRETSGTLALSDLGGGRGSEEGQHLTCTF